MGFITHVMYNLHVMRPQAADIGKSFNIVHVYILDATL
jgi:hypothetical protein